MLLGYQRNHSLEENPLLGFSTNQQTYLQIFVNLDPPLDILPPIKAQVIIYFFATMMIVLILLQI